MRRVANLRQVAASANYEAYTGAHQVWGAGGRLEDWVRALIKRERLGQSDPGVLTAHPRCVIDMVIWYVCERERESGM